MVQRNLEKLSTAAAQNTKERDFWLDQLSGEPVKTSFPYDYKKANLDEYRIDSVDFTFPGELSAKLVELSKASDYTLNLILIAGVTILLGKYTGNRDILLGMPIYRQDSEGDFINTVVVLKNPIESGMKFKYFLQQVAQTITDAVENQNYPIEILVEKLKLGNGGNGFPLFDAAVLLENIHRKEYLEHTPCNMIMAFRRENESIGGTVEYNSLLYEKTTIERIITHLINLFREGLPDVNQRLSDIEFLTGEEKKQLLVDFNDTETQPPVDKTIHRLFAGQAEKTPGNTAVAFPVDLSDIYDRLESTENPLGDETLAVCCFKANPYIYKRDLELHGRVGRLKMVKTNRHNSVIVNHNVVKLIGLFDGERNLMSLYNKFNDLKTHLNPGFLIYSMSMTDLLEVSFQFDPQPEIYFIEGFENFVKLAKTLYRNHLIQLVGVGDEGESSEGFSLEGFGEEMRPTNEILPEDIFLKDRQLEEAEALLLGDTPGTPSTGLLYLASYLRRKGVKACCRFYDPARDYGSMKENIESLLEKTRPKVVAVSMKWFLYIARVMDMCRIIKEFSRENSLEIKVVVGGNTASYYREEIVKYDCIDYLVQGDGEEPLLKICRGEDISGIPNCVYKKDGQIVENPVTYIQEGTSASEVYLSHLDEILLSRHASSLGTFFIYTHKGCAMNCLYCGGCNTAQQKTFNRKKVLKRGVEEVRTDIKAAKKYTSTFQFEFDVVEKNLLGYCRKIWTGIDLSDHFCIFSTLTPPSSQLVELVSTTFKYVYWDFDICTPSERHRQQLFSLGLVKPQPSDDQIFDFMTQCEKYSNIEVRLNLITGLPYFTLEDIEPGEQLLVKIMNNYSCFGELHWARLHAQPGAPIVENADKHHMHSYAATFKDFLKYSEENFNRETRYSTVEKYNYPYIYFKDDQLNSRVTNFYLEINKKADQYRDDKKRSLIVCETLTYRQLNERADQLAGALRAKGVCPGEIVAVLLERSLEIPLAVLAVLKTGAAYMPIDPEFPVKRVNYMLTDSNAKLLLTTGSLAKDGEKVSRLESGKNVEIFFIDSFLTPDFSPSPFLPYASSTPSNLAYVIYTSGTTGKSKGVLLTQKNLVNYVYWFSAAAHLTTKDKTVLTTSFAFDLGYTSLYTSLLKGGELHILPREIYLVAERLLEYIKQKAITYIKVTPSLFSVIIHAANFSPITCASLRAVVIGGEAINVSDVEKARSICQHLQIMNHYGPTEATIGCIATFVDFQRFEEYRMHPVIGKPIHNSRIHILGKDLNLLPVGIPGELCISGTGLARGYLNRPELTTEKFCKNFFFSPFTFHLSPLYRTGDLARWLPDGNIEFLGRVDHQVKVRGYRIELGEIESRLRELPKIEEALVVVKEEENGDKHLCAYIVPVGDRDKDASPEKDEKKVVTLGEGGIAETLTRFSRQVEKDPGKAAVKSNGKSLTYGILDQAAGRLARIIDKNYDDRYQLSKSEKVRYKRQMLLHGWGIGGQEKLKGTTVFVAGAGGGGSPTIMQLALLGFGTIKICDYDEIELSNLNRQFIHDEERLGMKKVLSAKITVNRTNPNLTVIPYTQELTRDNVFELVGDSEMIFDMFDGPADKFILSECAVTKQIPHLIIAMTDINAYAAVLHTPHTPCYHCLFDWKKLEAIVSGMQNYVDNYSKNPLAVAATSLFISTGTIINEALKILLGLDEPAYNKFFYFNQRGGSRDLPYTPGYRAMTHLFSDHFRRISREQGFDWETGWRGNLMEVLDVKPDPDCPVCGSKGGEKRKALEEQMKKAKEAPLLTEIKRENQAGKRGIVALLLNQGIEMAAGFIAVLKAGKTYVPLDLTADAGRLSDMLEDSGARVILTNNAHLNLAEKLRNKVNKNIKIIEVSIPDELSVSVEDPGPGDFNAAIEPGQPAGMLYPQDSSGDPAFNRSMKEFYDVLLKRNGTYIVESGSPKDERGGGKIDPDLLAAVLRDYLEEELPEYMIPSYFVPLDRIPLTANGKVDLNALPDHETRGGRVRKYTPPRDELEEKLVEIWSEILGAEKSTIGIDTNFFEAGGHSLNAAVMVAKVHKELKLKLSLAEVFEVPTIRGISSLISVVRWTSDEKTDTDQEEEEITL